MVDSVLHAIDVYEGELLRFLSEMFREKREGERLRLAAAGILGQIGAFEDPRLPTDAFVGEPDLRRGGISSEQGEREEERRTNF